MAEWGWGSSWRRNLPNRLVQAMWRKL